MTEFLNESMGWLFFAYLSGSIVTYFLMLKSTFIDASERTIDTLIDAGFIRTRKNKDGELEILKWNHKEEDL